ncbi:MAG: Phosphomannomutase/phosphoglucomutase [Candidatus Peregrinibacteria bacterium GW2011_GWA2_33_10]|nr:MAG: Phosphomannomutase/phosphoglucomutase [Candidatus Peregrinibacteria bacterium GW2011_GWA2_33_10]KKP40943.1 MAG: phosphomannomutase, phosphomannomutase / phosphoglucomutase [Candidatus Peregrinibacteria bacterium GW2011_GWC2_33_13]
MPLNPNIFRAYDIRGIAETDLQQKEAELIGKAAGVYFIEHHGSNIVVGQDCRISSPQITEAFIKGLTSVGCNVTDLELCTSPMMYFAVCHKNFDGGVAITASHNPKEYNGIKLVGAHAHSICDQELQTILKIAKKNEFPVHNGAYQKYDIFNDYLNKIKEIIKPGKKLKIGIDAGNGIAGPFAPKIFQELGFEVHPLYCEPDGNFPNHEANPEYAENLLDLSKLVKEKKLDLGIGFDGDGDRVGIIDENGNYIDADKLIILLSSDTLKNYPNSPIVVDIKCSNTVLKEIKKLGGTPVISRTGHSYIETKMKEVAAPLAGEVSGHIFLGGKYYGFDDGIYAAAKILEIISNSDKKISEHFTSLPITYTTPEIKAACDDNLKFQLMEKIKTFFENKYKCNNLDGVRIDFDENNWGLIRCSNTTPCFTMRFEAESPEKLAEIQKTVYNHLRSYPEISTDWYKY